MKKSLFLIGITFSAFSCNKTNNTPTIASADFTVSKDLLYVVEPLIVRATDTTGNMAYNFDFGDGTRVTGGYNTTHQYSSGGTFKITMSIYGKASTKTIRVLPGALSYQLKNSSSRDLDVFTYIDNPANGTAFRRYYAPGQISDTLYATTLEATGPNLLHPYRATVFINNKEYNVNPQSMGFVSERMHHILEIKDSSQVSPRSYSGSSTNLTYYLKDL